MTYIINEHSQEPAMRFEGLVRYAFDCGRGGGPNNIADAHLFDHEFIPEITAKGLIIMDQIIDALIDLPNLESKSEPINIKSSLSEKINQDIGIALIEYIIKTIKE